PDSAGRPCVEMAILDRDGTPMLQGEAGEVATRGSHTLIGYIGDEAGTQALYVGDAWLKSGDIGRIDEDGFLHLIDRLKDIIISGGENIFPAEVERALYQHPAVHECAVFGVPHDKWGEVPAAHVVKTEGIPDEATLIAFVEQQIPHYKRPRFIKFVKALPRTAIGKVQKNIIRAEYWKGRERMI
ncbi:MAG: AMP-binding protein, partial [Rhodospirillaceae bacterium]|nr:AMP-binding protein [Rhodospirillaceae bacterium]